MTTPDAASQAPPTSVQHRAAVVGFPAAHSLSPTIHRRAYQLTGLDDWRYDIVELQPNELAPFLDGLDATWRGLSVTMPLKEVAARLGTPDRLVERTGVANTVVIDGHDPTQRRVYNTDVAGVQAALRSAGVPDLRTVTVVGSGATALSAMVALGSMGMRSIITARNPDKAAALAQRGADWGYATDTIPWGAFPVTDGVISTVPPEAMAPHVASVLRAGARVVFDVIYHPWPTPLAAQAQTAGAAVVSGLDLLVHQAVEQFRLFTGRTVETSDLLLAVRAEAARRSAT